MHIKQEIYYTKENEKVVFDLEQVCSDFADKLMAINPKYVVQFQVFDPDEMYKDTHKK